MPAQKVDLPPPPPEPIVSRPLKTGKEFVLVLHQHRYVYRAWDKELYKPGDEAELFVQGEDLGDKPYEFVIENSGAGHLSFAEVARVQAQVDGGKKASAKYKFPQPPPSGQVTKAEWKRDKAKAGERLGIHVEAEGFDQASIEIAVERQEEGGWKQVAAWRAEIVHGRADDVYQIPPAPKKTGPAP